jgi:beta-D-xylosidase 4
VTGDCGAVDAAFAPYPTTHNFTADSSFGHLGHGYTLLPNTSIQSAGLDIDCTRANLSLALGTTADTDAALRHLWAIQIRLGRFDPLSASPYNALGWESMGTEQHQKLSLEAAQQSIVLLKNLGETLPISADEPKRIAILGPTIEIRSGGYSGRGTGGPFTASTAAFIALYTNASTTVIPGCIDVSCTDDSGIAAAVATAAAADVVLVAIGISSDGDATDRFEAENDDRRALSGDIRLPGHQGDRVSKVAAAARHPIIVMVTGSSADLTQLKSNDKVGAIIWRGYSGEASGMATADVLFGRFNPSGRLTTTWYPQSFVTAWKPGIDPYTGGPNPPRNASYFDHHVRPNETTGNPGRGGFAQLHPTPPPSAPPLSSGSPGR